jgi:hypothetical protein
MQPIDILGDDIHPIDKLFHLDKCHVPRVRLRLIDDLSTMFVPLPDTLGVRHERLDVRELLGPEFRP